jgi:hypothetical protein
VAPRSEKNRRRDQTARLPGKRRRLGPKSDRRLDGEPRDAAHPFAPSTEAGYEHTCRECGCLEGDEEHTGGVGIDPS